MVGDWKKKKLTRSTLSYDLYFGPLADRRVAALHILSKRRNLFLTVTDLPGSVVSSISAKFFSPDRKKRLAPHIVELAVRRLIVALKVYRIFAVRFFVKVPTPHIVKAAARALKSAGIGVTFAIDAFAIAHNGCRKKKRRRI